MSSAVVPRVAAAAAVAVAALDGATRKRPALLHHHKPVMCSSLAVPDAQPKWFNAGSLNKSWSDSTDLSVQIGEVKALQIDVLEQSLQREAPVLRSPNALKEYELKKCLGRGAFGEVFCAKHKLTGELRAVKRSRRNTNSKAYHDEVQALATLDHPGVVSLIEYFSDGDDDYLVEELCAGHDLLSCIEESEAEFDGIPYVPEKRSADIVKQCLQALATCHAKGYAHRDLKPENFVVDENGLVKLIDFGLAAPPSPTTGKHRGRCLGSSPYMAPEMVIEDVHSVAVDMWSMGVVFFTLLTGEFLLPEEQSRAFRCLSDKTFVERRLAKCKILGQVGVSDEAKDLLKQMLEYDPSKRITAEQALAHPLLSASAVARVESE
jgi:serine/threonine protein kinase